MYTTTLNRTQPVNMMLSAVMQLKTVKQHMRSLALGNLYETSQTQTKSHGPQLNSLITEHSTTPGCLQLVKILDIFWNLVDAPGIFYN